ncbi:MAG: cupin domain-containing protein [Elusimicrobia bacterium]|nr:cupin domain-containing protein [Elusimicrobiota bacterium]
MPNRITVDYRITCPAQEIEKFTRYITFEQTVEVPEDSPLSAHIQENVIGKIEKIEPVPSQKDRFEVRLSYDTHLSGFQLPQLINLIYGNISIQKGVLLTDFHLPQDLLSRFKGPNYGIDGIRKILGVFGRPLLATAVKPNGTPVKQMAEIVKEFALGGGDIIKDDQNLPSRDFAAFRERAEACHYAAEEINSRTGRKTLYFPILSAPLEDLDRYLEFIVQKGIRGILICPMIMGLESVRSIAARYPLIIMAHPSFTGTHFQDTHHGIPPSILYGKIFRLIGTDISVYTNVGGRFSMTREECLAIAQRLQEPWDNLRPSFPSPAGGMRLENLPGLMKDYGEPSVFLIGGALLMHSQDLRRSTEKFMSLIQKEFRERLEPPETALASACEIPGNGAKRELLYHLPFEKSFHWVGRSPTEYKPTQELPFREVSRHELIGKNGEKTSFELRYFEIQPGGYTSLEKHVHDHTVICVRGKGILAREKEKILLKTMDIGYVGSLQTHQLRNESQKPFGFFCIVDKNRDKPRKP